MKIPSKFHRRLSFNRYRKRWGALRHVRTEYDFAAMKENVIQLGDAVQTRGSEKSLDQHLDNLRREFSNQPELLWHHAKLIVLIRREFQIPKIYSEFRLLWEEETDFLCEHLNMRWLIAASDTFAEHDDDMAVRGAAMVTSALVNTVKMYESERLLGHADELALDPKSMERVQKELVPLFEGMSCFTVGTDDTLRNMLWRLQPFMTVQLAGSILAEIWRRLQVEDTVFKRMRAVHTREKTRWW
ncbi:hypothetical protein [Thalassobacter stenotrophicus]|uniref:Uncharacterized protein n=2 Tax=Thalassobacter stenotrophicus TaxID=266809 RepID=A0A0P1F262_9RHOB|nr:hypothetical protein [Thalassobacter stenotrophicus]CUH61632.1 hypothetical protein THS5294_02943 [Thalassobacter stenotrophicus]SHI45936.1 hypothetical protein SAMN02744035_00692 [Thalassobacter stenotrophicus DSM 16310]